MGPVAGVGDVLDEGEGAGGRRGAFGVARVEGEGGAADGGVGAVRAADVGLLGRDGEGGVEGAEGLAEPAAQEPVPGLGDDEPQGVVGGAGAVAGLQGGAQVARLGVEAFEPGALLTAAQEGAAVSASAR